MKRQIYWQSPVNVINMSFRKITNQFNDGPDMGIMATIILTFNHIIQALGKRKLFANAVHDRMKLRKKSFE